MWNNGFNIEVENNESHKVEIQACKIKIDNQEKENEELQIKNSQLTEELVRRERWSFHW